GAGEPGTGPRRAPAGEPASAAPPWHRMRMRVPVSVPGGTVMFTWRSVRTSPAPWQVGHGWDGMRPRPRHWGHGRFTAKPPWPNEMVPLPLHSGQVDQVAPGAPPEPAQVGQGSVTCRVTATFPPNAAT